MKSIVTFFSAAFLLSIACNAFGPSATSTPVPTPIPPGCDQEKLSAWLDRVNPLWEEASAKVADVLANPDSLNNPLTAIQLGADAVRFQSEFSALDPPPCAEQAQSVLDQLGVDWVGIGEDFLAGDMDAVNQALEAADISAVEFETMLDDLEGELAP